MNSPAPETDSRRPIVLATWLVIASLAGLLAAFSLTVDKFRLLEHPNAQLGCNVSVLVGCSTNLRSWQGSLFGFPNPLLGLGCWSAALVVAVGLLTGARFSRAFWLVFNVGVLGGFALVLWLITQSLFALDVLCPWCMVTWSVMIPTFWAVTLHNLKTGVLPVPTRARAAFAVLYGWVPTITLISFAVVAAVAQWQLNWLGMVFVS
jgi:uncharacterized membrane protein